MRGFWKAATAFAASFALALTGCGGGGSGSSPSSAVPAVVAPASSQRAPMTVTVERQAMTSTASTDSRHVLTIPSGANAVEVDAYSGTLPLPAAKSLFTPPLHTQPVTVTCANFPANQTQTTVTTQVPVGAATLVISANAGSCSGEAAAGAVLSQASGTGTATAAGGDIGTTFFDSGNGVDLSTITPPANGKIVQVALTSPWTDTGISVAAGQTVTINGSGEMNWYTGSCNGTCISGPAGKACSYTGFTDPNLPCWSMTAEIGSNQQNPVVVDPSATITATQSGELYVGVNDNFYPDNTGSFQATITVGDPGNSSNKNPTCATMSTSEKAGKCPQVGDVVIYRSGGKIVHSGLIADIGPDGKTVTKVDSKWGVYGLYEHDPNDIPSNYGTWSVYHTNRKNGNLLTVVISTNYQSLGSQEYETDSNPPEFIFSFPTFNQWLYYAKSMWLSSPSLYQSILNFYGYSLTDSIVPTVDEANTWLYRQGLLSKVKMLNGGEPSLAYDCHGYTFTNKQAWIGENVKGGSEIDEILHDNGYGNPVPSLDTKGLAH